METRHAWYYYLLEFVAGWILIGIGMLAMAVMLSRHFGKVRTG